MAIITGLTFITMSFSNQKQGASQIRLIPFPDPRVDPAEFRRSDEILHMLDSLFALFPRVLLEVANFSPRNQDGPLSTISLSSFGFSFFFAFWRLCYCHTDVALSPNRSRDETCFSRVFCSMSRATMLFILVRFFGSAIEHCLVCTSQEPV